MFYVAHRLFVAHDRALGAMIAQQLGTAVGMNEVFLPFCDTDEEDLVAEIKGRRLFELDRERLMRLDGMLAVLHGPSLDDGVCMEVGYAAALGVPVVVLTTDFQTYWPSEHEAALHFPDALVQAVVTEIVRLDGLAPSVDHGTRSRRSGIATSASSPVPSALTSTALSITLGRHRRAGPRSPQPGPLRFANILHTTAAPTGRVQSDCWRTVATVYQPQRFGAANPLVAARRDWSQLLSCQLLVVDTTGPETLCGAAVMIGAAAALARRIIAWHPTPSWTFARGREPNWRNLMIQYAVHARVWDVRSLEVLV